MRILIILLTTCIFSNFGYSQNSCSKYYPFSEGAISELTLYNKKDKPQGKVVYEVIEVSESEMGMQANMNTILYDKNGKEISSSNYEAVCKDGLVSIDFNSLMNSGMMSAYSGMDIEADVTGTNIEMPNELSVGDKLPDANVTVAMNISGLNMNMTTEITDREVLGEETITTPAGTFDCFVLTQTTSSKSMGPSIKTTSKQWIAEGVGIVKTEDYRKNGKLESKALLTSFSK